MEKELASLRAHNLQFRDDLITRRQRRNGLLAAADEMGQPSKRALSAAVLMLLCTEKFNQKHQLRANLGTDLLNELRSTENITLESTNNSPVSGSESTVTTSTLTKTKNCVISPVSEPTENLSVENPSTVTIHASSGPKNTSSDLESLLHATTAREREIQRINKEINYLLNTPSVMERARNRKFRSHGGSQVQLFCIHGTRNDCRRATDREDCAKLHFKKIIHAHTDESLGDCSFLNTCFHVETCKYVHYQIDPADLTSTEAAEAAGAYLRGTRGPLPSPLSPAIPLYPAQWINCDIRQLDMTVLGKFSVIMADPPWDIHMELPYGTMSDEEMRRMNIPCLQDDGYIFLWVTGRAMELGRDCLKLWGYRCVDELIWVKTNQLQRLIRTGRTGHWLNHGKEHCLIGMKGRPRRVNKGLDCDVLVSEVRETSRKPDEVYGLIERLSPGTRKLELFGRPHNLQANWLTLGNQLDGTYLVDPVVVERYRKRYPQGTEGDRENEAIVE